MRRKLEVGDLKAGRDGRASKEPEIINQHCLQELHLPLEIQLIFDFLFYAHVRRLRGK